MKFVHIADMHFDVPFTSLNSKPDLCEKRRLEQREAFRKVIEYVKQEDIPYLFIAGDLFEHEYVRKSTIDFISGCFKQIPDTKVFISPGNHDPYVRDSYYDTYEFSDNVFIFRNSRIEKYEDENLNLYGIAFTDFYMNYSPINNFYSIPNSEKPNILLAHIDLNGANDKNGFSYNPVLESKLKSLDFDYCAIGHIHKNNLDKKSRICYPGSPISLGFDELGSHGMIVGDITKDSLNIDFVTLDDREFQEINIDVSEIFSKEELVENINTLYLEPQNFYKVNLVGNRNFEINTREIIRLINNINIFKIKDLTSIRYNIDELIKQNNLKGYFIREVKNIYDKGLCTEEEFLKAIEIGLNAM